jgi:hypothetical protein
MVFLYSGFIVFMHACMVNLGEVGWTWLQSPQ